MNLGRWLSLGLCLVLISAGCSGSAVAEVPLPVPKPVAAARSVDAGAGSASGGQAVAVARIDAIAPSGLAGWMAVDLDSGRVIGQHNADVGFAPASVAKLPTAAYALDVLGPGHRFTTRVLTTGPLQGNRIMGDLILQGGADPGLDTDALALLVERLHRLGVRSIAGRLIADGSALPQVSQITPGQKVYAAFNPSVSGLNLNFNRVRVKWDARKGHDSLSVEATAAHLSPQIDSVDVVLASAPEGPIFSHRWRDGREIWLMARRAYRGQAARWLPVKNPAIYAAGVFRTLAAEQGVHLPRPEPGLAPSTARVLASTQSRPLGEILRSMLKYSTNLTAEVTGSAATRVLGIKARTLSQSAAAMNHWAAGTAGFPAGDPGFQMANHSGLTLQSRVSPRRMVELLVALTERAEVGHAGKVEGLPGGVATYLESYRFEGAPDGVRIVAKTGTMSYVCGLAGYVLTAEGKRLAFAVFLNDLARRGPGAEHVNRRWINRARTFERALITNWVARAG